MRVIAGSARSIPLISPEGLETRPTSDKIKETLFNMLQRVVEDSRFLDLFAGSGQIGIEALSRGAEEAVFVERSKEALRCVNANLKKTGFEGRASVIKMDVLSAIRSLETEKRKFDLIFMDPPYGKGIEEQVLSLAAFRSILDDHGTIIIETDKSLDFSYVEGLDYLIVKDKIYKNNRHIFLKKKQKSEGNEV